MDKDSLLYDMEVQFAPEDREKYGADWFTYSELAIVSMRARELMDIEAAIGVPIATVMDNFRRDATFANMVAAWLATGRKLEFKDFNPLILQADWRKKESVEVGKSLASPESEPGETPTAPEGFGALPTSPAAE